MGQQLKFSASEIEAREIFAGREACPPVQLDEVEIIDQRMMNKRDSAMYVVLSLLWIATGVFFWQWWLQPANHVYAVAAMIFSWALFYESTLLPMMYLFFLGQMKKPKHLKPPHPDEVTVAMVTLCVPSKESQDVITDQINAMLGVNFPHDVWILDDEGAEWLERTVAAYRELGYENLYYFSRAGYPEFNTDSGAFSKKTKSGNFNSWLYAYGGNYDFVTQLDIDHKPRRSYLDAVLGYFRDPGVAWVMAPSVVSGNIEGIWTVRGTVEQDVILQGPLQSGFYGATRTPFIIGSHCTYRRDALDLIGGMQINRAEDHLDTVVLAAEGYRGVYVPEVIAVGNGPETFGDYAGQQFAWAYSMIQVLFHYTPRYIGGYKLRQGIQFLFSQTWYTFWGSAMGLLFLMPLLVLILDQPLANVEFGEFIVRFMPMNIVTFGIWFWSRRWFKPAKVGLSWRGVVLQVARWPIVLYALMNVIFNVRRPYMITSKGMSNGVRRLGVSSFIPYFVFIAGSLAAIWFNLLVHPGQAHGYILFALEGAALMGAVYALALIMDIRQMVGFGVGKFKAVAVRIVPIVLLAVMLVAIGYTAIESVDEIIVAITWSREPVQEMQEVTELSLVVNRVVELPDASR